MGQRVAVVGAGYAGMSAAVTLAERGVPVTVFESGPVPGGRARRINAQGQEIDNGQHILVGAYTSLLQLMNKVGAPADAFLRLPLELRYAKDFSLRAPRWPARLGLLAGLLSARGLTLGERLGAIRFMSALRRARFRLATDVSVARLLEEHRQTGKIAHYLWRPLCVSALNTPPERASANIFLAALRDTLSGPADASDLLLPRVDLSRLFPEPAMDYVRKHGGEVRLRTAVQEIAELKKDFSAIIVAVGPHQLMALLPEAPVAFTYQPIYTCYLQYPGDAQLPFPMLGLADGLVQWVFDRGALLGEKGRLACVISAQGDHQQLEQAELAERCHRELTQAFHLPPPQWSRVIAEKRATISCEVALQRLPQQLDGVILAGDYTDMEYPPTLEAAVRSGVRAALQVSQ